MLSIEHEAIVRLFTERPQLAADLLGDALHVPLPDYDFVTAECAELTEATPSELRADSVIVFRRLKSDTDPEPVLAVIVEVQRSPERHKRWTWPMYLVSLRTRMKCPAMLLVICPEASVARWCAKPIELGHPGLTLIPLVAGPTSVPMITEPLQAARDPELAILSIITHATTPQAPDILDALLAAVHDLDPDQGGRYADMVRAALPAEIWEHLEKAMKTERYEYLSEWARGNVAEGEAKGEAKGKVKGKAEAIFTVLSTRGFEIPDDARARISDCDDLDQLDAWIRAAITTESLQALLDKKP
jgi:hypothetical protein